MKELTCTHTMDMDNAKQLHTHYDENYFTFDFALLLLFTQQQHSFTNKTFVIEYMPIMIKETI